MPDLLTDDELLELVEAAVAGEALAGPRYVFIAPRVEALPRVQVANHPGKLFTLAHRARFERDQRPTRLGNPERRVTSSKKEKPCGCDKGATQAATED